MGLILGGGKTRRLVARDYRQPRPDLSIHGGDSYAPSTLTSKISRLEAVLTLPNLIQPFRGRYKDKAAALLILPDYLS